MLPLKHKEPGGFFKSTDGGLKWRASKELKNEALHSLVQSKSDPNVLVTGTFNGMFRSDDSGETWQELPTHNTAGLVHVESLAMDPRTPDIIYAGTWYIPTKKRRRQDWKSIKHGISDDSTFGIDIDQRDPNHVIASPQRKSMRPRTEGNGQGRDSVQSEGPRYPATSSVPGLVFPVPLRVFGIRKKAVTQTPGWTTRGRRDQLD